MSVICPSDALHPMLHHSEQHMAVMNSFQESNGPNKQTIKHTHTHAYKKQEKRREEKRREEKRREEKKRGRNRKEKQINKKVTILKIKN